MKKLNLIFFIVMYFLAACAAPPPQATVTPDATVTLPPIPTPTLHPQMSALREKITASGDRFTLDVADGLIYDGETPIPGLTVAPDGAMSLTVNGESVTLDPADVDFDDENGITIDGYEWDPDANDGAGAWLEAAETVTLGGVILTLDANGVVTEMEATGANEEIKAENLAKVDPMAWGFEEGEARIVKDTTGTHIVVDGENVAKWVGTEWEWDWQVMEGLEGGNPLFDFAKTWEMLTNGTPQDMKAAREDSAEIMEFSRQQVENMTGTYRHPIYLYDGDTQSEAIGAYLITQGKVLDPQKVDSGVADGWICFKTASGELVSMRFDDIEVTLRRFN